MILKCVSSWILARRVGMVVCFLFLLGFENGLHMPVPGCGSVGMCGHGRGSKKSCVMGIGLGVVWDWVLRRMAGGARFCLNSNKSNVKSLFVRNLNKILPDPTVSKGKPLGA